MSPYLAAVLMLGCGGNVYRVDAKCSSVCGRELAMQDAADAWVNVGAAPIVFVFNQRIEIGSDGNIVLCIAASAAKAEGLFLIPDTFGVTRRRGIEGTRIIMAADRLTESSFRPQFGHELGHSYGIHHLQERTAVMWAAPWQTIPQPADVAALRAATPSSGDSP